MSTARDKPLGVKSHVTQLSEYLQSHVPEGRIGHPQLPQLIALLSKAWLDLEGGDDASMAARKLNRIENPEWHPPFLTFDIERHGAVVQGSVNAEVQTWQVDPQSGAAEVIWAGVRRICKSAPRLDVVPLAHEVAQAILSGKDDARIVWRSDRLAVKVTTGAILPPAVKQTTEDRRARFFVALDAELASAGYMRAGAWYRRAPA